MTEPTENLYRLPESVTPSRYDIILEPDLAAATYGGIVDVVLVITEPVDQILLNAKELAFGTSWLELGGDQRIEVTSVDLEPDTERARLKLASTAQPGDATLHIEFTGSINDKLRGFYRSTYTDDQGEHVLGATQFEPTDARQAFPCWDEPACKAIFGLTMIVDEDDAAFANGPEVSSESLGDGRRRVRFADTMVMSTYLVAWMVGRLAVTDPIDVNGTPVRVIHVPGKESLTAFALDVANHSLPFFSDYYGIDYPEAKLDMAALPDFAAGAMENPGLVTFREAALLVDPDGATQTEQQRVADTTMHEIAHMWFGDLVTMRWWNGIWLNEAFATFMALLAVDSFRPEWKTFDSFAVYRSEALEVDGLLSTRAIEYEVISPDDIEDMFDVLTYQKGASVLWMLERYLGPDLFREGIRAYLAEHAYGNTETYDLWDALETATGEPVRRVMDAWIWQGGYPAVTLGLDGDAVTLSQDRFTYQPLPHGADAATWPTPYRVRTSHGTESILLEADGASLPAGDGAVVGDADAFGFVRTRYQEPLLSRIAQAFPTLSPLERTGLVDDTWAEVQAGGLGIDGFLSLAERLTGETELSVWKAALGGLSWCDRIIDAESRDGLRAFTRGVLSPTLERIGWEPAAAEGDLERELRGTIVRAMGLLGRDADTIRRSTALERAARGGAAGDGALTAAAVAVAASAASEDDWETFAALYHDGATPQVQRRYLQALPMFPQPELVDRGFARALDGYVRSQDRFILLGGYLATRQHGEAAWALIKDNWDALTHDMTPHLRYYMVEPVRLFFTAELRADVLAFFEDHPLTGIETLLTQALERQAIAVSLRERSTEALAARFG